VVVTIVLALCGRQSLGCEKLPGRLMSVTDRDPAEPRLLDRVREVIRLRHYSIRTEQVYLQWITRFILFHSSVTHATWEQLS
jgi:Phage integrase, N-terminal SAM-like domain